MMKIITHFYFTHPKPNRTRTQQYKLCVIWELPRIYFFSFWIQFFLSKAKWIVYFHSFLCSLTRSHAHTFALVFTRNLKYKATAFFSLKVYNFPRTSMKTATKKWYGTWSFVYCLWFSFCLMVCLMTTIYTHRNGHHFRHIKVY